ncbi:ChaN family lipoprotein [Aliiruegeria haliotis]|nr:ChaN family lipoprotein [Aliiruegeria haliotis]
MSLALSASAGAAEIASVEALDMSGAQIVLLGEVHDNPAHHLAQAAAVAALEPTALVFEMLNAAQAGIVNEMDRSDPQALADAIGWDDGGWPDFEMYHPVFLAAPSAPVYGMAVDRDDLLDAMKRGAADVFGGGAEDSGLGPLPEAVQAEREAFQLAAHCDALPEEMLGGMVEAQRLRDARFAAVALQALEETGGPVAVITGNGHTRKDWGMPVYLEAMSPGISVVSLAQVELRADPDQPHDTWIVTEAAEREDPCAVFTKG